MKTIAILFALLLVAVQVPGCAFISIIGAGRPPANCLSGAAAVSVAAAASAILGPSSGLAPNYSAAMTLEQDPDRHRSGKLMPRAPPVACTVWLRAMLLAAAFSLVGLIADTAKVCQK